MYLFSRFPFCAVSIGYFEDKQAQCAVVYNPISDQMFFAERGKGAFINEKKLIVSQCSGIFYLFFTF